MDVRRDSVVKKRAHTAGTVKGSTKKIPVRIIHPHCITFMLAIATLIAEQNISNVWDGIVTIIIALATLMMTEGLIKEVDNGKR